MKTFSSNHSQNKKLYPNYFSNYKKIKIEPIHKLNNGNGATLCNLCGVIISVGLTNDLFCEKHNQKIKKQD